MTYTAKDVSIILPIYCKSEESLIWLDECLSSIVDQGCDVVVYNDGSPVSVNDVVSRYNVTKYISASSNSGVSCARNRCAEAVRTPLIFPLDCDDTIVPDTIRHLSSLFNDIPLYPDICKFGTEEVPHYALLNFHCDHVYNFVGFTSVNVLHTKQQWKQIGGWDESIDFYEDGEYNARLFGNFCGVRCPHPLVHYRMHEEQRTKQYRDVATDYAKRLMSQIRSYNMACCGKSKTTKTPKLTSTPRITGVRGSEVATMDVAGEAQTLPLEFEGKRLVQYVGGKGKGKHYYKPSTNSPSLKVKHGDLLYVDPVVIEDMKIDKQRPNYLIEVTRDEKPAEQVKDKPVEEKASSEKKSKKVSRTPVASKVEKSPISDIPEISKLSVKKIKALDLTTDLAETLLQIEKSGRKRSTVIEYLQSKLS